MSPQKLRAGDIADDALFFTRELFDEGQPHEEVRETYYRRKGEAYLICGYRQGGVDPETNTYQARAAHTNFIGVATYPLKTLGTLRAFPIEQSVFGRPPTRRHKLARLWRRLKAVFLRLTRNRP